MTDERRLTIGFPRMYNEPGERRAFLPPLMGLLAETGVNVYVETGCGAGMGYSDDDYVAQSPRVHIVDEATAYAQDIVVVLCAPRALPAAAARRDPVLDAPLHHAAGARRAAELGVEAIALDMVTGDDGRRLVQNLREVARNGLAAAFDALERRWPPFLSNTRPPVTVTILGAGGVGKHAIEWAAKAGDEARNARLMREGLPGIEVVVAEQNLAGNEAYFRHRLALTDILVDATARRDTSRPIFPNAWLDLLPEHAIVCDLAVDPYLLDDDPPVVRGIEGIPRATWTSGSSARTIRPGTACPRRSRRDTGGRSSPATRGRACSPSPAWRPTGRRSRR